MSQAGFEPRVLLAPGFLGEWRRGAELLESVAVSESDLSTVQLVARLRDMAARLPADGLLAGFISYEAALALDRIRPLAPGMPFPEPVDGRSMPAAWIGAFARTEVASPPSAGPVDVPYAVAGETEKAYQAKVEAVIEAILRGDLFQANLSRRLAAEWPEAPSPRALFHRLADGTHAPYAALIELAEGAVLSASPELFLLVEGGRVTAEPIKGTRPRGATPAEDERLAADLLASEKDRAENVMIADLMRNDLSLVAADGTMREEAVCALRTTPRVHHLYSRISARLRDGLDAFDALAAAFPCGSITGAPKLAAMRQIASLEGIGPGSGRGAYCGTVFAVSGDRATFSVPIRTGVLTYGERRARLDVRVGGGITAMSDPAKEWAETVDKAYPFTLMTGLPA